MSNQSALEIEMQKAVDVMTTNFELYKDKVELLNSTCESALQVAEARERKSEEMKLMLLKVKDLLESGDSAQALTYLNVHNIKDL